MDFLVFLVQFFEILNGSDQLIYLDLLLFILVGLIGFGLFLAVLVLLELIDHMVVLDDLLLHVLAHALLNFYQVLYFFVCLLLIVALFFLSLHLLALLLVVFTELLHLSLKVLPLLRLVLGLLLSICYELAHLCDVISLLDAIILKLQVLVLKLLLPVSNAIKTLILFFLRF